MEGAVWGELVTNGGGRRTLLKLLWRGFVAILAILQYCDKLMAHRRLHQAAPSAVCTRLVLTSAVA